MQVVRPVAVGTLEVGEWVYTPLGTATLDVTISHAGDGVVAHGTVDVDLQTECSRCLQPFVLHVQGEVEGLYVTSMDSVWAEEEDAEPIRGGELDLAPAVEAAIRVELPLAPLHDENCKGICPECGCDLNTDTCSCDTGLERPSPFDALRGIFDSAHEVEDDGES